MLEARRTHVQSAKSNEEYRSQIGKRLVNAMTGAGYLLSTLCLSPTSLAMGARSGAGMKLV